jgi:hypothetical protein
MSRHLFSGVIVKTCFQSAVLIFILNVMKLLEFSFVSAGTILIVIFLVRFVVTKLASDSFINQISDSKETFPVKQYTITEFNEKYVTIDDKKMIYIKKKNLISHMISNKEMYAIVEEKNSNLVKVFETFNVYL